MFRLIGALFILLVSTTSWGAGNCQFLLMAGASYEDAAQFESAILEAYRSLITSIGEGMVTTADLAQMLSTGDYFFLTDQGSSNRDHLISGLKQLEEAVNAHGIDSDHLMERIRVLIHDRLGLVSGEVRNAEERRERQSSINRGVVKIRFEASFDMEKWEKMHAFSSTGGLLIGLESSSDGSGNIKYFLRFTDLGSGTVTQPDLPALRHMLHSPDWRSLGLFFEDGTFHVLDVDTLVLKPVINNIDLDKVAFDLVSFSQDGKIFFLWEKNKNGRSTSYSIRPFDWRLGEQTAPSDSFEVDSIDDWISATPDGSYVAFNQFKRKSFWDRFNPQINKYTAQMQLLDRTDPKKTRKIALGDIYTPFGLHGGPFPTYYDRLLFSPNMESFAHGRYNHFLVDLWKVGTAPEKMIDIKTRPWGALFFSSDSRFLATHTAAVYNTGTQKEVLSAVIKHLDSDPGPKSAFSADSRSFARSGRGQIEVYDTKNWLLVAKIPTSHRIETLEFTPDGEKIVFRSLDTNHVQWLELHPLTF